MYRHKLIGSGHCVRYTKIFISRLAVYHQLLLFFLFFFGGGGCHKNGLIYNNMWSTHNNNHEKKKIEHNIKIDIISKHFAISSIAF